MNNLKLINDTPYRLIYSFYLNSELNSIYDDNSYIMHLICLESISNYTYNTFDEIIFIISINDLNSNLIYELKCKLIEIFINSKHIQFIIEKDNKAGREGYIFKKYVIDKFNEYDGLTLFFHNKRLKPTYSLSYNENDPDITYWIIGQYYFNMFNNKEELGVFLRNKNKLIYGWPYMHDNWHPQWLIGGNCFWMKCKDIYKYINDNNLINKELHIRCVSEFYFPEIFDKELIDYPLSDTIKDTLQISKYYEPSIENSFLDYLQNSLTYKSYINFMNFYDYIINEYNKKINSNNI